MATGRAGAGGERAGEGGLADLFFARALGQKRSWCNVARERRWEGPRCANQVLAEFRTMDLTEDTHAFLHGLETKVPGSYLQGRVLCGNDRCKQLEARWKVLRAKGATWKQCLGMECEECRRERKSRCRVLMEKGAGAYASASAWLEGGVGMEDFTEAVCIVPNNDTRTEINKARSRRFAAERGEQLQWCMAEDVVSAKALNIEQDLCQRKVEFLRRTDKSCGDLSGIVPLVQKMPVFLTQHIDRGPERNLLKGKRCVIEDWVLDERDWVDYAQYVCFFGSFSGTTWFSHKGE